FAVSESPQSIPSTRWHCRLAELAAHRTCRLKEASRVIPVSALERVSQLCEALDDRADRRPRVRGIPEEQLGRQIRRCIGEPRRVTEPGAGGSDERFGLSAGDGERRRGRERARNE